MKLNTLFVICLALGLTACAEKEQAAAPADEAAAAATNAAATNAAAPAAEVAMGEQDEMGTAAFIEHMHHHASQLGQLKAALEVGSLAAAQRPAYWLAGHDEIAGVPEGWMVHIHGMRDGANAVDSAENIAEARVAAQQIEASCNGCHLAAGVDMENLPMD